MRTEKRQAEVGERILITNSFPQMVSANNSDCEYVNREVFTVRAVRPDYVFISENMGTIISHDEYEVIVEDDPKSAWILAPADITHRALKGQRGTVVAYDSQTGEVKLKVDERTLVILHVDWIDQSRYLSGEFSK